jgi:hypothetical protein
MDADPNAIDELTALFMSDHEPAPLELVGGETEPEGDHGPMHVTVAICGHLPVMAGLWVTQFADRIGEANGPTGLLRLEGGRCSLELFRTSRDEARINQGSSLLDSLQSMGGMLRRWIVCVDESDAAEAVRCGVDEVVVLTGADKPAVLAAYRIAKTASARLLPDDDVRLGLVVVGADAKRSQAVGEVLGIAAGEYMNKAIGVADTIERMDVIESARRMLFAERERATPGEAIALLRGLGPKVSVGLEAKDTEPEQVVGPEILDAIELPDEEESPLRFIDAEPPIAPRSGVRLPPIVPPLSDPSLDLEVATQPQPVTQPFTQPFTQPATQPLTRKVLIESIDEPPAAEEPSRRESDRTGLLMHFPEFDPLSFSCPHAKDVALALDSTGQLRLLCPVDKLADARVVSAWAHANSALLRAAIPSLATGTIEPIVDLITEDAVAVADLHHTGVRLYLLTPLEIEGETRWHRVDLNSEETAQIL